MEMDLNTRGAKWKKEEQKRRDAAKRKLQTEQLKRAAADKVQREMERVQAQKRQERLAEQAQLEELALEEQRVTGGIKYLQRLRPVPAVTDGDKITLPVSALEELNPQNAHELGVFTFELLYEDPLTQTTRKTHAGVLEFVAEEGTVGLPPKVAASLFRNLGGSSNSVGQVPEAIQVKYIRLEKGKFASLQPRGVGFGEREIDFKKILERSLKAHTTLTVGDVLFVRHGKETFEVLVAELQPEAAVNILNTDLEVALLPSEAITNAKEIKRKREEALAAAAARAAELANEKERRKAEKLTALVLEPPAEERLQVKIALRLPGGAQNIRYFLHASPLGHIFDFVEALTGEPATCFQLAATFPRRIFGVDAKEKTLKELGLNGRQEALFVEKISDPAAVLIEEGDQAMETQDAGLELSSRTHLPDQWEEARQQLEKSLDEMLNANTSTPIHAIEPIMPVAQSSNHETKWEAQLAELEAMGFLNRALNIEILERYQGRLLRVVNYLSEMPVESAGTGEGVTAMED
uniref:UBX domain-containing protein n=1 Tax=Globisporangium ultimum (strain ATCC 200006 / CBS 805.95 / DAOM BR144) TaxID=431595 RepID=K3WWI9_GLOUD